MTASEFLVSVAETFEKLGPEHRAMAHEARDRAWIAMNEEAEARGDIPTVAATTKVDAATKPKRKKRT